MSIAIPASLIENGTGIPHVCARHGESAVVGKPVKFWSKPPIWSYPLIVIGVLPFVIVTLLVRKEVRASAWPFCARCVRLHHSRLTIGIVLLLVWPVSLLSVSAAEDAGAPLVLVAFVALFVGIVLVGRGTYRALPWGFTSQDGAFVSFPKGHPAFGAAAQAAYTQAAQQYAAWQASQHAAHNPNAVLPDSQ
jgi:hypothetical protein